MNELTVFQNQEFGRLRTAEIDGEIWFVGKDVARALGYKNPQEAIRYHVDAEDKGVSEFLTPRWQAETAHHQRKRPVQSGAFQQAARREAVQTLGHERGFAQHPQAWRVRQRGERRTDGRNCPAHGRRDGRRDCETVERRSGPVNAVCAGGSRFDGPRTPAAAALPQRHHHAGP